MIKLQENKNKRNETMSNDRKKYLKRIKKNKTEKETPLPLYETNPIVLGEKTSPDASELAVKLAKKWVDENRL